MGKYPRCSKAAKKISKQTDDAPFLEQPFFALRGNPKDSIILKPIACGKRTGGNFAASLKEPGIQTSSTPCEKQHPVAQNRENEEDLIQKTKGQKQPSDFLGAENIAKSRQRPGRAACWQEKEQGRAGKVEKGELGQPPQMQKAGIRSRKIRNNALLQDFITQKATGRDAGVLRAENPPLPFLQSITLLGKLPAISPPDAGIRRGKQHQEAAQY